MLTFSWTHISKINNCGQDFVLKRLFLFFRSNEVNLIHISEVVIDFYLLFHNNHTNRNIILTDKRTKLMVLRW